MTAINRRLTRKEKRRKEFDVDNMINHLNQKFSLRKIQPITKTQETMFKRYGEGYHLAAIGSAGTGKTMCAMYLGLKDIIEKNTHDKLILIRSAVQTRDQGFMPGSLKEKISYYESPYIDIVNDLFSDKNAYGLMKQKGLIEFMSSSFVRGLTFDNAIILVDECQSCNFHELDTIMTRVGQNSKIIFCGDVKQDDLKTGGRNKFDISGLKDFIRVIRKLKSFNVVEFTPDDIVRSGLVKQYIIAKEELELA